MDRATQRGLIYDVGCILEDDLNNKLKTKHIRVHALFVPMARDEMIPALLEGRGDVAMANLTVITERQKQVEFTAPSTRNFSEIVVTGSGAKE